MSRNRNELASETGSGIVGFVLVAPLVVAIFVAIGQIAMLVADKSVLNSAAVIGARTASAADASNADGRSAVLGVLASRGAGFRPESSSDSSGSRAANSAAELVANDFDSRNQEITTKISCSKKPCLSPGGFVTVIVSKKVKLDLPRALGSRSVVVTSQHTAIVDELRSP